MGLCSSSAPPDPAQAAISGIRASTRLQPFNYLVSAGATLGQPVTAGGKTYDFTGLGQGDVAAKVSDQMAQTLLDIQKETSPAIIAQRLAELKAADPQGYAARQQLFDAIQAQANSNPGRPVSQDLQDQIQAQLDKGVGFNDAKQAEQYREQVRGGQSKGGIFLGAAPAAQEAAAMTQAGESLQSQRQQDALALLQSGASPEDIAYRNFQQNMANYGNFVAGQTPTAQFQQLTSSATGPTSLLGGSPNISFDPNAAGIGANAALGIYQGQTTLNQRPNPWLAGASVLFTGLGGLNKMGAFNSGGNPQMGSGTSTSGPPGGGVW